MSMENIFKGAYEIVMNITELIKRKEYDFINTNEHLKDKIMFLVLGGSHAYGTNIEGSDVDLRGCTLNSRGDILGLSSFEQFIDNRTDTTIYGFNKLIKLLINCNPNTIELLGCSKEDYAMVSDLGQILLDNSDLFLSQKCIKSFGGYSDSQFHKLQIKQSKGNLDKISKHAMHLLRLYMMLIDILEKQKIITYRKDERELLLDIRNGVYTEPNGVMCGDFYDIVDEYKFNLEYAKLNTSLREKPNMKRIEELVIYINECAIKKS